MCIVLVWVRRTGKHKMSSRDDIRTRPGTRAIGVWTLSPRSCLALLLAPHFILVFRSLLSTTLIT
eukprot:scaffold7422_cov73-Skeletonema_dohrnii-CCMP3373.AAC.3